MTDVDRLAELRGELDRAALTNRVRALLHRWYTFYEREDANLDHQLELVGEDFEMIRPAESALPTTYGRNGYRGSLADLPPGQENSHHLRTLEVTPGGAGSARCAVTHQYETRGPSLNGAALLRYDFEVGYEPGAGIPVLTRLEERIEDLREAPFEDAYLENRVQAFVYRWLALVENPAPTAEPLGELVADDLVMTISGGRTLQGWDQIAAWYEGSIGQVEVSSHVVENLTIDDQLRVSMDLVWQGIVDEHGAMVARTHHDWVLEETGKRYLRAREFSSDTLEPFTPVDPEEALKRLRAAR